MAFMVRGEQQVVFRIMHSAMVRTNKMCFMWFSYMVEVGKNMSAPGGKCFTDGFVARVRMGW